MSLSKAECLRVHYREAFEQWALQVSRLQAAVESASPLGVSEAEERVTAAEFAYRDSRDRLTNEMMADSAEPPSSEKPIHK